jgi:hypothetical protein
VIRDERNEEAAGNGRERRRKGAVETGATSKRDERSAHAKRERQAGETKEECEESGQTDEKWLVWAGRWVMCLSDRERENLAWRQKKKKKKKKKLLLFLSPAALFRGNRTGVLTLAEESHSQAASLRRREEPWCCSDSRRANSADAGPYQAHCGPQVSLVPKGAVQMTEASGQIINRRVNLRANTTGKDGGR